MHAVPLILMCILTFLSEHRPHPASHTLNPSQSTDPALAPLSSSSLSTEV